MKGHFFVYRIFSLFTKLSQPSFYAVISGSVFVFLPVDMPLLQRSEKLLVPK